MNTFSSYFFEGGFGLERETLRLDKNGRLAQTPHPFDDPHLQRGILPNCDLDLCGTECKCANRLRYIGWY